MAYDEITYANKVENNGITPAGRFGADDLNEIKAVTNANGANFDGRIDVLEAGGGGPVGNPVSSSFVGDGATVSFVLTFTPTTGSSSAFVVGIDGVLQSPVDAYTVSTNTGEITFSSAPPVGSDIVVTTSSISATDISESTVVATGSTEDRKLTDRFADTVNVKDFGAVGDGVADDTAAIQAAVDVGTGLYWPAGTYLTTASISNLHTVKHSGEGAIKRGTDTFYVQQDGQNNLIYVDTSGLASNDGLSSSEPFLTIQEAIDVWAKYCTVNNGRWYIKLAAGTYTEGGVVSAIQNISELTVEGVSKTTTILDGTTATSVMGLNFNASGSFRVKNLKVQNWGGVGSGIIFQNGTTGVIDTCDAHSNAEANFNCSSESVIYIVGACSMTGVSKFGLRVYGQSRGSIGDGVNLINIVGSTQTGLLSRDGSTVVVNNNLNVSDCNAFSSTYGVLAQKQGYVELRDCNISTNSVGIGAENNSIIDTQTGTRTLTGNTRDYKVVQNSVDRSLFSTSQTATQVWTPNSNPSGNVPSDGYDLVVDYDGITGLQFITNGNNVNIDFDKQSRISYVQSDGTLRLTSGNVDALRLYGAPSSGNTGMFLLVNDGSTTTLRAVKVGATDSGGSGQRLLTVDN